MQFKKTALAMAVTGVLLGYQGVALATVDISANPVVPAQYAQEIIAPATLTNNATSLNLQFNQGYSMSSLEVRYARVECSSNMKFNAGSVVVPPATINAGAINGLGTSAIHFSVSDLGGGTPAASTYLINGNRDVSSIADVQCTYSLYDQPSQAAGGGEVGRIYSTGAKPYIDFTPGVVLEVNWDGHGVASVDTTPPFTQFDTTLSWWWWSSTLVGIGEYSLYATGALNALGFPTTLDDLLDTGSKLVFTGDFSARAAGGVTAGSGCPATAVSTVSDTKAEVNLNDAQANLWYDELCYQVTGDKQIPKSKYFVALSPKSETGYNVPPLGPIYLGDIVRNGTELQAPLAQMPDGWGSRIILTNTGTADRTYSIRLLNGNGNTVVAGSTTSGVIPAGQFVKVDTTSMVASITGSPVGATVIVTVSGPADEITGLYQLWQISTGNITNHVLVARGEI